MPLSSYRDLDVWEKAMQLVAESYVQKKRFPAVERFGLTAQIRRAAVSVASNIAEGHERRHLGDYLRHLSMARSSVAEVGADFTLAGRLQYVRRRDLAKVCYCPMT
jgi:four helix bundle protein